MGRASYLLAGRRITFDHLTAMWGPIHPPGMPSGTPGVTTSPRDPDRQRPHVSGKVVIVGHTPLIGGELLDLGHIVCIGTDCSRCGWLTRLEVNTGLAIRANRGGDCQSKHKCLI